MRICCHAVVLASTISWLPFAVASVLARSEARSPSVHLHGTPLMFLIAGFVCINTLLAWTKGPKTCQHFLAMPVTAAGGVTKVKFPCGT